jgi:DNA end-binding protein Ku
MVTAKRSWTLSFGLVRVPIKISPATGEVYSKGKMHNIHASCSTKLTQPKTCAHCERTVSSDEIIKGFEISKSEIITLSDEELSNEFIPNYDPWVKDQRVQDKIYKVEPGDDSLSTAKAFSLVNQTLFESNEVGVAKVAFSTEEHLCLLRPGDAVPAFFGRGLMVMQTCIWQTQLRDIGQGVTVPVSDKERGLARMIINKFHQDKFDPLKYTDVYEEKLLELVMSKRNGQPIVVTAPIVNQNESSLIDQLLASVENVI